MNEQRQEAYVNLIQSLLNCPSGEKAEILRANAELVDAGLVEMMLAVADVASREGDENVASWLVNLARELAKVLNLTAEEPHPSPLLGGEGTDSPVDEEGLGERFRFLMEVLQAIIDSRGNPDVIYPLLAANTDKLDDIFAEILQLWGTETLAQEEPDRATYIAAVIVEFSNLIQQFPLGSKASNMEIAIAGYEVAATVFTETAFPQQWAMTQNNLGIAYSDRIKGDKADNIESAIAAYKESLKIRTETAFPQDWAMTQNNLGTAYSHRIKGDKADNIESAIAAYKESLKI
ncbi:MAG: hypothetical protein VKL59_06475, partial [Nostocaceae cyanobacterium]|nr:hypothetical protein [Nostocaceae cyanobacterium]